MHSVVYRQLLIYARATVNAETPPRRFHKHIGMGTRVSVRRIVLKASTHTHTYTHIRGGKISDNIQFIHIFIVRFDMGFFLGLLCVHTHGVLFAYAYNDVVICVFVMWCVYIVCVDGFSIDRQHFLFAHNTLVVKKHTHTHTTSNTHSVHAFYT